jgi:hypothetical protein
MSQEQSDKLNPQVLSEVQYDPPRLTYCGNLHDLLADNSVSTLFDALSGAGSGHDTTGC